MNKFIYSLNVLCSSVCVKSTYSGVVNLKKMDDELFHDEAKNESNTRIAIKLYMWEFGQNNSKM